MPSPIRLLTALSAALLLSACQPGGQDIELSGAAQGTTYHIKLALSGPDIDREALRKTVEDVFADIDAKLSNYREDSAISKLNAQKTTAWLPVPREIAELVAIAQQVHAKSSGCYDLTVKPIFDLWGFSRHEGKTPQQADIDRVLPHVGMDKLELDFAGSRLRKKDPELMVDLSSIAQGYTVGVIAGLLEARGIQNYMAEIGGEMRVKGHKANGELWRIALEKPTPFTREAQKIFAIHQEGGESIMTSGTYRNFFEEQGKVYSHIINPKTGKPVDHKLLSTTVLHDDPAWADAWSTALLCLGEDAGYQAAEANRLRALFIYNADGKLQERLSSELTRVPE